MTLVVAKGVRLRSGRYELDRQLGRGGAATVWLARDTLLERPVAVKILTEGLIEDRAWIARFKREARVAAGLQHPNLVSIYDFEAEAERPYLVMAYLSGGSLAQRLANGGCPDLERLAGDVLRALAHIHGAGIIHRDVKPGNVLLDPDGHACLSDFGVARPEDATAITQAGEVPGTARYMAPELWRGAVADERSDLYACGVLLSECVRPETPVGVRVLAERLRAEDRDGRPVSAAHALRALGEEPARAVAAPRTPDTTPAARAEWLAGASHTPAEQGVPSRARWLPVAALAAVAVGAGVFIAGALQDDDGQRRAQTPARTAARTATSDGGAAAAPRTTAPAPAPPATDGAALNNQGYALIQRGRYEEAVPVLQRAVAALRGSGGLDYAFALFNLGNALRLAGRPAEAIPILEQRLAIPNQTKVVKAELKQARKDLKRARGPGG
jgi:serine/threonine-protein kinase